jgi:hypothetical protein
MAKWFALFPTREYLLRWLAIYSAAAVATGVAFLVVASGRRLVPVHLFRL